MKINDRLNIFNKKLDEIIDFTKSNRNDIDTMKNDLYKNNGKICLFTRVKHLEKSTENNNLKIATFSGICAAIIFYFNNLINR